MIRVAILAVVKDHIVHSFMQLVSQFPAKILQRNHWALLPNAPDMTEWHDSNRARTATAFCKVDPGFFLIEMNDSP